MILKSRDGSLFKLRVLNYEFPQLEREPYDSDWLLVACRARSRDGGWEWTASCLLTWELRDLANWLESLAEGGPVEQRMEFTEPVLQFEWLRQEQGEIVLRVYFALEANPPWYPEYQFGDDAYSVEFALTVDDVRGAAEALKAFVRRFPQRAGVSRRR